MKRLTRNQVDEIAMLHQRMKEAEAAYEAAVNPVRRLEPGVYTGHGPKLILSTASRERVDWDSVCRVAKVPKRVVARFTKEKPYTRVDIVHPGEPS